jgi:hypothetical protein
LNPVPLDLSADTLPLHHRSHGDDDEDEDEFSANIGADTNALTAGPGDDTDVPPNH